MINHYISEFLPQGDNIGIVSTRLSLPEGEHSHAYYQLIFHRSGRGRHYVDGKWVEMREGSVLFVDRGVPHAAVPEEEMEYDELLLSPDFFESPTDSAELHRIFYTDEDFQPEAVLNAEERVAVGAILGAVSSELEKRAGDFRAIIRAYARLLTLYLARAVERARSELANRDPAYILAVTLEYVDKHFTENISQEELAERFHYNSAYFSRMFKKHQGMNFSDYITNKRISYAAELLATTDMSAEQISEAVGYKSKPQFYNTFVRYMGVTPRQYRLDKR